MKRRGDGPDWPDGRTWSGLGLVKDAKLLCVETETFVVELLVTKLSH